MRYWHHNAPQGRGRGSSLWLFLFALGITLTSGRLYGAADSSSKKAEECRLALEAQQSKPGLFSRFSASAQDYWLHQKNLQFAVNHADRNLFSALVRDGVIATGSIERLENVDAATTAAHALPTFNVTDREYVRLRVQGLAGADPNTIQGEIITGGRSYRVQLAATHTRVQEFLATNNITISTGMGPYREAQVPAGIAASPSPTFPDNPFASLIMTLAREQGIAQEVLGRVDPRSLSLVNIQAGSFDMGSPIGETGRYDDEKQHRVQLTKNFEMQATAVTQFVWLILMSNNPSHFTNKKYAENDYAKIKGKTNDIELLINHPVEKVSYEDIKTFLKKLNDLMRRYNPGFVGEFTLPTEAQWEYAARAGTTNRYGIDETRDSLNDIAWTNENSGGHTHAVGALQANPWGLFDMSGNVWEWVKDWYASTYLYADVTAEEIDPAGPHSGSSRVLRGGSWLSDARYARLARRDYVPPGARYVDLGFRFVWAH